MKKNAQYIFYLHIFISWKKVFSIFYTHHRIPNKHMMTINFDTITNNYEVIYVIKTVMKYYLKKIVVSVFQIWFNVYLLTSYMTRFGLWIFMSKITHDFWLCETWKCADPEFSLWRVLWRPTAPASRTKSRRTAEESRTTITGATSGAGTYFLSRAPEFNIGFKYESSCSICYYICSVLSTVVCLFVLLLFTVVLSVLRLMISNYPLTWYIDVSSGL